MDKLYTSRLRHFRKEHDKKLKQAKFAELLEVGTEHYVNIELGTGNPSIPVHVDICLELNKPSDFFFKEERHEMILSPEQAEKLMNTDEATLEAMLSFLQTLYEKTKELVATAD